MMASDYFSVHTHSEYSWLDGMGTVDEIVEVVASLGQPGLALTDHGTMAGAIRLYKQCRKHGIAPFPGEEFYLVESVNDDTKKVRYHLGLLALNEQGFETLVRLSTRSHQRDRFHKKPLIDLHDLGALKGNTDLALTTGCYFGLPMQTLANTTNPVEARRKTKRVLSMFQSWLPYTYVELQWHNNTNDVLNLVMYELAQELGLPVVFGQDSHYCHAEDQPVHDMMKDICYFGDSDDNRFPGGPYHLASTEEVQKLVPSVMWDDIEAGHEDLLDKHALRLPGLDKYQFHVPKVSNFPSDMLRKKVNRGLDRIGQTNNPDYLKQVRHELDVIDVLGFANYFLLVEDLTSWCKLNHVIFNARGSVNGCLVAYLIGITTVDPIVWGTNFDRFLSLSRRKPPDIDLDIESSGRWKAIEYLQRKHPTMVNIGTYSRIGISNNDTDQGSVFVQYMAAMRRKHKDKFTGTVAPEHRDALNKLADMAVRKAPGVHAAGFVLPGENWPIDKYLAVQLIPSSNTYCTQAAMEDVEDAGYVKLDMLGVKSLATMNRALVNIGYKANEYDWIPWDDKKTCQTLRSGNCTGIFQFHGKANAMGGKEMKIRSTMDAIICMALYRPALMNGGQKDLYLANRGSQQQIRLHKFFDPILDVTHGVPVFQEQIMEMCLSVGLPEDLWNELMKAVKASNDKIAQHAVEIMSRVRPVFLKLCGKHGMTRTEGEDAWHAVTGFTDYGFNRAHATSYGIMAYRSAYLKTHYPLEYMQALLATWAGTPEERVYIREARRLGIKIGRADVNKSDTLWTIDKTARVPTLRKGLLSIKGVGGKAADFIVAERTLHGEFKDMDDFVDRCQGREVTGGKDWKKNGSLKGVMLTLRDADALGSLGVQ